MTGSRRTAVLILLAAAVIAAGAWVYFDPSLAEPGERPVAGGPGGALVDPRPAADDCEQGEYRLCSPPSDVHAALGPDSRVLVVWLADLTADAGVRLYARQLSARGRPAGPVLDLGAQDPLTLGSRPPGVAGVPDGWIVSTPANADDRVAGVHVTPANALTPRERVPILPADRHVRPLDPFCQPAVEVTTPQARFRVGEDPDQRLRVDPTSTCP